ncbi:MAG TPA: ComEC/Rec2 family competence protein [Anaerolineaceae bacterium]|nr:ComEC/Rec2 family competence protein [Anaerolineaceae bacterium]
MPQSQPTHISAQSARQRAGKSAPINPNTPNAQLQTTSAVTAPKTVDKTEIKIPKLKPFFWLAIAALLGTLAAEWLKLDWQPWLVLAAMGGLMGFIALRGRSRLLPKGRLPLGLALAAFGLSAMLYVFSLPVFNPQFCAYYNEQGDVDLEVVVVEPPEVRDGNQNLVVKLVSLHPLYIESPGFNPNKISGKVQIQTAPGEAYAYGDRLRLRAELKTPPEGSGFDYRAYLRHQGIYSSVQYARLEKIGSGQGNPLLQIIYSVRLQAMKSLDGIFPAQESALLKGILLGDSHALSDELKSAYALTGTAHIYAISGFNMVVLANLVTHFLTRKHKNWKSGLAVIGVLGFYTLLVGASASVVRAAIMGSLALIGSLMGRRGNLLNTLGLTVFLMLLLNPHLPWDIGFQLTVMATLGLAVFSAPLSARLEEFLSKRYSPEASFGWSAIIGDYFIVTLVAQASVLPLIAYHFRQVSALFLIANPLVLPVQPPVMVLGLLAMLGGMLSLGLGKVLAWLAWPFAAYTNACVQFLADLWPDALRLPRFDFVWVLLAYALILVVLFNKKTATAPWLNARTILLGTGVIGLFLWVYAAGLPDGRLKLRIIPGQDRANLFITTPSGRHIVVGGSGSANALSASLSQALPLTHQELDWLVIPRCGRSDVSALYSLPEQIKVRQVLWLCDWERIQTTKTLFNRFSQLGLSQRKALTEDALLLEPGLTLEFGLREDLLESIHIEAINFSFLFEKEGAETNSGLQLTPEKLILSTSNCTGICPEIESGFASYNLADYAWLEIQSDGRSLSLSGKR